MGSFSISALTPGLARAAVSVRIQPPALTEPLRAAWQRSTSTRLQEAISRPTVHPATGACIHLLGVTHGSAVSASHVTAVLNAVQPDAVALELPPGLLSKAVDTRGLSDTLRKLSRIQGPLDAFTLISDKELAAWSRRSSKIKWAGPLDSDDAMQGDMSQVELFAAILWAQCRGVPVDGIDAGHGSRPAEQWGEACAALGPHVLPSLLATLAQSDALRAVGARRWWDQVVGQAGVTERGAVAAIALGVLQGAMQGEDWLHYRGLQRAAAPEAYGVLIEGRDAAMVGGLSDMCAGRGAYAGRASARCVVVVVGQAHVHGIRDGLLRTLS